MHNLMPQEAVADPKSEEGAKENSETKKGKQDMPETKQGETEKSEKSVEGKAITLRSLTMDDLRQAKDQVSCCWQFFPVNINLITLRKDC